MAPGLCGLVGGRPKASPVLKLFSFLHLKNNVPVYIQYQEQEVEMFHDRDADPGRAEEELVEENIVRCGSHSYYLSDMAYARSGDKGNGANIGVVARHPAYVPYLRKHLTVDVVQKYFQHLFPRELQGPLVERYEVPGIHAFNFVMKQCLGGGGVASLRTDPQGKSFAQMLLDLKINDLPNLKELIK